MTVLSGSRDATPAPLLTGAGDATDCPALPTSARIRQEPGGADIGLYLVILDGAVIRALVTAGVADLFDIYTTTEAARRARC